MQFTHRIGLNSLQTIAMMRVSLLCQIYFEWIAVSVIICRRDAMR